MGPDYQNFLRDIESASGGDATRRWTRKGSTYRPFIPHIGNIASPHHRRRGNVRTSRRAFLWLGAALQYFILSRHSGQHTGESKSPCVEWSFSLTEEALRPEDGRMSAARVAHPVEHPPDLVVSIAGATESFRRHVGRKSALDGMQQLVSAHGHL